MTGSERRLQAEWELLQSLSQINPGRLTGASVEDREFRVEVQETPARLLDGSLSQVHRLRVFYPSHFPAVPLELYIEHAFRHPNVHPETGFVCLWERHSVDNTVEHAIHKLVAMMDGRLCNRNALHVMQPDALQDMERGHTEVLQAVGSHPLLGIAHDTFALEPRAGHQPPRRRVRLS